MAEQWFRRRMDVILSGDLQNNRDTSHLVPIVEWKSKLDVLKSSKAIHRRIQKVSEAFLAMQLPTPRA